MTVGETGRAHRSSPAMQPGQHNMSPAGANPQTPQGNPSQTPDQQLMSPAPNGGQGMSMGQPMTAGTFPLISGTMGTHNATTMPVQYAMTINQHGQQVLQPISFSGMPTMSAQTAQQPGHQYIFTTSLPQQAKQGGQQPQIMTSVAPVAVSQSVSKGMSQAPTYTLTSSGLVSQTGGQQPHIMITQQLGGSPNLQATASNMVPTTSMTSHNKAEPGKPMQTAQQPQQMGAQQPMILPPGVQFVNPQVPGAIFQYVRPTQDGQATPQLMISPQGIAMQAHTQALQPGMTTQQLPPGLTTSMQPMSSMATSVNSTVVRPPMGYSSQPPAGKTQISRAPPILLPATSTTTIATSRTSTSTAFMTQPSPKSKQKMSPRTTGPSPLSTKGLSTAQAAKSILNNIKNQSASMTPSPPVLTSSAGSPLIMPPGSPSTLAGVGPPVLQTSLTAPPLQSSNSHSQPPLLQPMMMPSSAGSNTTSSYVNGKPVTIAQTVNNSGGNFKGYEAKVPIMPSIKKAIAPNPAAPMEQMSKSSSDSVTNGSSTANKSKPSQECLTHVIDGHVIHESSQPFPLEDDTKGRPRKKSESTAPVTTSVPSLVSRPLPNINTNNSSSTPQKIETVEKKRGPGRPPGSTKHNLLLQQQQQQQQLQQQRQNAGDIVKVSKDEGPVNKKAKLDYENGPPTLTKALPTSTPKAPTSAPPQAPAVSEVKAKYNIDVVQNNPLKWSVAQVCDFVKNLPGCSDYVEDFQLQEIDGQALMLLKTDHLMSAMAIRLGPALKICNAIEAMREELKQN